MSAVPFYAIDTSRRSAESPYLIKRVPQLTVTRASSLSASVEHLGSDTKKSVPLSPIRLSSLDTSRIRSWSLNHLEHQNPPKRETEGMMDLFGVHT